LAGRRDAKEIAEIPDSGCSRREAIAIGELSGARRATWTSDLAFLLT
jgi:hypothetical protein